EPLNRDFERWQRSFPFDQQLLAEELAASRAYARALHLAGGLSAAELESITGGLNQIAEKAMIDPGLHGEDDAEDIHHFVEKSLVNMIGDTGYKLHTGRSRNEQISTDLRLFVRDRIDHLRELLSEWLAVLLARATQAGEITMPAYTHLQRAEPVLVAHWLLAYFEMFFRDAGRLADCRDRLNACPLGSGAIAGATVPIDRNAVAAELGFDEPTANSIDATSDRDFALEFTQALSILAIHFSRWAEEIVLFSSQEFGFVRLPESYSTGSSAMPQKKNPDAAELIRGKTGSIIGNSTSLLITLKGLPLAYNKDLQETQLPVLDSAATMTEVLKIATGFLQAAGFDFERMQNASQFGFTNSMAAATYLSKRGVPLRRAHEDIGRATRLCLEKKCEIQNLSIEELREFNPEFKDDIYAHLSPEAVLDCHDVVGGTARARVKQALASAAQRLTALQGELHAYA
ncbi:MAG TPA: argininosuccinate lyase, partial [Candidatus Eremiobacteraceae bacterium]|nr:argininosuccinate lyase [Candidatus Eremiobacteraceae bacterium]